MTFSGAHVALPRGKHNATKNSSVSSMNGTEP